MSEPLKTDPSRRQDWVHTGIYVRALQPDGSWEQVDITELSAASLRAWLRSGGGANELAENTVAALLGYDRVKRNE